MPWPAASASRYAASAAFRCITGRRVSAAIQKPANPSGLAGKYVPHFKPGKELRDRVNGALQREKAEAAMESFQQGNPNTLGDPSN